MFHSFFGGDTFFGVLCSCSRKLHEFSGFWCQVSMEEFFIHLSYSLQSLKGVIWGVRSFSVDTRILQLFLGEARVTRELAISLYDFLRGSGCDCLKLLEFCSSGLFTMTQPTLSCLQDS